MAEIKAKKAMPKVLLVEDEKMLVDMYKDKFDAESIETIIAYSVEEALAALKQNSGSIGLILLDILLPGESGFSLLERIKEREKMRDIPVIIFSNYDDAKARKEAFSFGVKEYVIKTQYTPGEIVAKIRKYLSDS